MTEAAEEKACLDRFQIERIMDMQVRRDIDQFRARSFWRKVLAGTPTEELVEALSMALATGRYQETPKPKCCGCCHGNRTA